LYTNNIELKQDNFLIDNIFYWHIVKTCLPENIAVRDQMFLGMQDYRSDNTSSKTFASGAGGMGFKSQADQISHTMPTIRHRCNLDCVGLNAKPWRWAPLTRDTQKGGY